MYGNDFHNDSFGAGEDEETEGAPKPVFVNVSYPEKVKPGESFKIFTTIKNEGSTGVIWR